MAEAGLDGRVALITGGGRGIGAAAAKALAQAGASVAVNFVANEGAAHETVAAIEAAGGRGFAVQADVSDGAQVSRLVAETERALGPVDILVANAGIAQRRKMEEVSEVDFNTILKTNLTSAFLCSQAVVPGMRARRWGRFVYISSGAARIGGRVGLHYAAAKGGMEALARAYAARLAGEAVTANCVAPALIDTDMTSSATAEQRSFVPPVGRTGHVDEVAVAVVMIARNAYLTGQTIHVNGGLYFN